tara:strand:+ start:3534 stop:3902 length:369 start_codon:yes stop_codon:yes gene_type:complete
MSTSKENKFLMAGILIPLFVSIGWILFAVGLDNRKLSTKHWGFMGQMGASWIVLALVGANLPSGIKMVLLRLLWLIMGIVFFILSFQGTFRESAEESTCKDFIDDGEEGNTRCSNIGCEEVS